MSPRSALAEVESPRTNSLEAYWMPFTGNRDFKQQPRLVTRSEGIYCWDQNGDKVVDGSSALFCCPAGHGRKDIADAVHRQLLENDYVAPFQLGHPAAFALAQKIADLLPDPINRVFFANSGSEAVDTALKVAMAYQRARGHGQRIRFVSRERAYHGVNIGGVSLSGLIKNREAFPATMPHVALMRHTWLEENRKTRGQPENGVELAEDLERICQTYGPETIAACFVEPVAGSTGTLVPPKGYLKRLREICDKHGILLVFDEVITGFGRLGTPFGCQKFDVVPDIVTMAKAMTNGAIPMGGVAVRDEIYDTINNSSPDGAIEFFHGYTFSAHPAACAAGLVAQELYTTGGLFERAAEIAPYFEDAIFSLADHPLVFDVRVSGLLAGVEVYSDGVPGRRGQQIQKDLFWNGCHIKFTGDSAIVAPAFIAERQHIDEIVDKIRKTLDQHQ